VSRRARLLAAAATACVAVPAAVAAGYLEYPAVVPGVALSFPSAHGSHPDYRVEWWYATGWLDTEAGETLRFQVTFFRTRPDLPAGNPSGFAATQLIIAHAAISDPQRGRLWHDQRIARAAHGLADAAVGDTDVWLDEWRLRREGARYEARVTGADFGFELALATTVPVLLNGSAGFSQKGPGPRQASYYYSQPQLAVSGTVERAGRAVRVTGVAWLDHEWSSEILDAEAAGWDWAGINLDDGGALMAFRIRDREGGTRWAAGTLRTADGSFVTFGPGEVEFVPGRRWRSPRTGIEYPVSFELRAGSLRYVLEPLLDDQESDSRFTTGAIYWEGAVRALREGRAAGRGYLELTGYGEPLRLPGSGPP